MKISAIILFSMMLLLMAGSFVSGENQSVTGDQTGGNQTGESLQINISPQELLMNLAFDAREYALENGKEKAVTVFSDKAGIFSANGSHIVAFDINGVLLADPSSPGDVGSRFITDDHDPGLVRVMRDLAASGGGLYSEPASGNYWFVSDIDGSWWICASRDTVPFP